MPAEPHHATILDKNAELAARLKVSEESLRQLKAAHEQLQAEHVQAIERKGMLEEEVRWLKGQLFGRSSERLTEPTLSPDQQKMLFNEAEVLAAIEAAEALDAQRTTTVAAHERNARPHTGGREPIPAHLPRKEIVHDELPPQQKWCEHDGACWMRQRIGEEIGRASCRERV